MQRPFYMTRNVFSSIGCAINVKILSFHMFLKFPGPTARYVRRKAYLRQTQRLVWNEITWIVAFSAFQKYHHQTLACWGLALVCLVQSAWPILIALTQSLSVSVEKRELCCSALITLVKCCHLNFPPKLATVHQADQCKAAELTFFNRNWQCLQEHYSQDNESVISAK